MLLMLTSPNSIWIYRCGLFSLRKMKVRLLRGPMQRLAMIKPVQRLKLTIILVGWDEMEGVELRNVQKKSFQQKGY